MLFFGAKSLVVISIICRSFFRIDSIFFAASNKPVNSIVDCLANIASLASMADMAAVFAFRASLIDNIRETMEAIPDTIAKMFNHIIVKHLKVLESLPRSSYIDASDPFVSKWPTYGCTNQW